MSEPYLTLGQRGEAIALDYLERRDYVLLARNWRCKFGELDLVMRDGDVIVFVEVRARKDGVESAFLSVDQRKQNKLRLAMTAYLASMGWDDMSVRLDVVAVKFDSSGEHGHLSHASDVLTW